MNHPNQLTVRLIRHAESAHVAASNTAKVKTFGGRQNHLELSERGQREAACLGRVSLQTGNIPTKVISSPAVRAVDTAKGALRAMNLLVPILLDDRLQEFDWGSWTGQPRSLLDEPETVADIYNLGLDWYAPGGTSMNDRADSLGSVLYDLEPENQGTDNVWLVCHRGIIRSYIGRKLGYDFRQIEAMAPDVVGVTTLVGYKDDWQLTAYNQSTLPADFE
jgi:broad specificity phosphatase PhoE